MNFSAGVLRKYATDVWFYTAYPEYNKLVSSNIIERIVNLHILDDKATCACINICNGCLLLFLIYLT